MPDRIDSELFLRLIRNILQTPAIEITNMSKQLIAFEETNCYNRVLQPMFTSEALSFLLDSAETGTMYEVVDQLGVCLSFFKFMEKTYLIGPYVKTAYSDMKMENILVENKFPSSHAISLKLYYTNFTLLYMNQLQNDVAAIMESFSPGMTPYGYRRLSGLTHESKESQKEKATEGIDYSIIYRRYDAERRFLSMVKNGDVENIIAAYKAMSENGVSSGIINEQKVYSNPAVSFAIVRALSRKAAEESGLSVITINEITQKYVQRYDSVHSRKESMELMSKMVIELTKAVADYKISAGKYSDAVRTVNEYIYFHLSENISLLQLAELVNMSESYLTRQYKKETGISIFSHIAKERCKKAAAMLKDSNLTIQEISCYVGYLDSNYFVKVFKKIYGVTPSEYRRTEFIL